MQQENPNEFYERLVHGTNKSKTISLEHASGATLENVTMSAVDKRTLASVIERLPEEMFEAVNETEDAEAAEEALEEQGTEIGANAVTESTVEAFEDLVSESLSHKDLSDGPMREIVEALSFDMLFQIGTEIINMSFDESDKIKDFHEAE